MINANVLNGSLIKSGTGQLKLSSAGNTYSDTVVNDGTLAFGTGGALPSNGVLTVNAPGIVNLNGFAQTIGNLSGSGNVSLSGATLTFGSSNSGGSFSGGLSGNGFVTKSGSGSTTLSGNNSFNGPLRVNDGTLVLSSANSFTGSILLNGGVLSVGADEALGNSGNTLALSGGTLEADGSFSTSRNLSSSVNSTLSVTSANQLTLNSSLSGSGTFNKAGSGSLKLTTSNPFTGQMNVNAGQLQLINGSSIVPNVGTFLIGVTGTLKLDRSGASGPLPGGLPAGGPPLGGPPLGGPPGPPDVRLNGGTLQVLGASGQIKSEDFATLYLDGGASTIETIPNGGTLSVNFGTLGTRAAGATLNWIAENPGITDKLTFASGIADPTFLGSWFTINGSDFARYDNTLGVQALNSYNNGFAVNTHVLLTASATLPVTPSPYPIKTLKLDSSGSLDVDLSSSTLQLDLGGLIKIGSGTSTISNGTLTVGSLSSELNISVSGGTLDISATIAQTGGGTFLLTKRGTGTLTLSGSNASSYSGVTMISGALELNKPAGTNAVPGDLLISGGLVTSQANEQIANSGIVTLNAGTFNLNGKTETIAQLINNNGTVLFNGGTLNTTITTLNGGTTTVASTLNASSTLNITGGKNTVSTSGVVNVGTLNLSGSSSASIELASGPASSGQLILSGNVNASPITGTLKIESTGAGAVPGKLDLGGAVRTFTVASGASREDLLVSAQIASGGITKAGPGMMQVSGSNTYAQGTILNAGTLEGTATSAFGSGSIQFGVGTTTVGVLGLRGDAVSNAFGNAIAAGSSARPMFVNIDRLNPGTGNSFVLGTAILGNNLTVTGAGTLQVSTTTLTTTAVINPYDTTLIINGAIGGGTNGLILGGPAASPGGVLPGQDKGGSSGSIGTLSLDGNTKSTFTGLTTVNDGTLILNHTPGQYALVGPLSITGGTVVCRQDDQFDHTVDVWMLAPGGIFDLSGTVQTIHNLTLQAGAAQTSGGTLNITGTVTTPPPAGGLPSGSSTPTPANASIQGNLSLAAGTSFNLLSASDQITLDANLSAPGGFSLSGLGQLNLNGTNTINGTITLNGGTISAATANSLGIATIVLNGGILNANGAIANRIVLGASGGQINVPLLQTLTMNQPLSGAGITKLGSGTLILSGANSFAGNVTLTAGTLQIAAEGNLGSASNPVLLNGGNLAYSQSLSTSRLITLSGGAIAVAAGQSVSLDGSGSLSGTGGLIKTGPGTLTINRPRSYQGVTQVSGGTLNLSQQPSELLAGGTLNSGIWIVESNSTLLMTGPAILSNKASVTLRGTGSSFSNLATLNRNEGNLNLEGGRTFTTATSLINSGNLTVGSGSGLKVVNSLSNTGTIELSGALVVDYTGSSPMASIKAQVQAGYASGTWRGSGINSSAAAGDPNKTIALAEASEAGVAFNLLATDSTSVIALCTARGDANLDSQVNSLDFNLFAANYGKGSGALWTQGDFTADGKVNTADFNYLAGSFGAGVGNSLPVGSPALDPVGPAPIPSAIPPALGSNVPEPGSLSAIATFIGLGVRRRRKVSPLT